MNDSISRKQLLKIMSDWQMEIARVGNEHEYDILEKVIQCICKQPIIYDEDKIVERLKEESHETYGHLKIISTEKAVEIVKTGGLDNELKTSSKTPSRQEAQKILRSCGILDNQNNIKPAYEKNITESSSNEPVGYF